MADSNTKPTLRCAEAAKMADISLPTLYQAIRENKFPVIRFGRVIRISRAGFLRYLEGTEKAGEAQW